MTTENLPGELPVTNRLGTAHGCPSAVDHDREVPDIDLLSPLTIRGVSVRNRIVLSPMCQYSADEGLASENAESSPARNRNSNSRSVAAFRTPSAWQLAFWVFATILTIGSILFWPTR